MKKIILTVFFLLIFFISAFPKVTAAECSLGSVHAQFQLQRGAWENATGHPRLQRGEPFELRITVTPTAVLQVFFLKLHEFGTPVFEVVEGPTMMEQILENRDRPMLHRTYNYTWRMRVRPDTAWVNGYAPLEVYAQFNTNDSSSDSVHFDVVVAYILDDPWDAPRRGNSSTAKNIAHNQEHTLPGFESTITLITICAWYIFKKK